MQFDPAFLAMLPEDLRIIAIGVGVLLLPHLAAGLFWSVVLRLKLAVPAVIVGLLLSQGLAVTMTSGFGWFGHAQDSGRAALCILLWMVMTLIVLNVLAAIVTRSAPPIGFDSQSVRPVPFWPTGLFDWVLRQDEAVKSEMYVPPSSQPPREGLD